MELAAEHGPAALTAAIGRRLGSLEASRGQITWRQRPAFIRDGESFTAWSSTCLSNPLRWAMAPTPLKIEVPGFGEVSGLWQCPNQPTACLTLAHGAGAGMTHQTMAAIAAGVDSRGVATLRYQFPYMEKGSKRPDAPALAHATVRAAAVEARRLARDLPLFASGRSFGGRMTSQAQALQLLQGVVGLIFFAFPLHPAGKPSVTRAAHLADVTIPMLFVQGSSDALAQLDLLQVTVAKLTSSVTVELLDDADHAFHVPARSGRKDAVVLARALDVALGWMANVS